MDGKSSKTSLRLQPLPTPNGAATLPRGLNGTQQSPVSSPNTRPRANTFSEAPSPQEKKVDDVDDTKKEMKVDSRNNGTDPTGRRMSVLEKVKLFDSKPTESVHYNERSIDVSPRDTKKSQLAFQDKRRPQSEILEKPEHSRNLRKIKGASLLLNEEKQQRKLDVNDELSQYCIPELPINQELKGLGSWGSVHRIELNGINCIAKRLHDILLGQGKEAQMSLEDKRAAYQKFRRECILLSRMRHPNIVQFMGVHYGPQRDYGRELTLVMECLYINLEECLKKYSNIEMWLKISILLDVSQGLLHLHSLDVIHRDLTAPNILLTTSFHAKIADLGVSKIIDVHPLAATKQSMIPGTLGYMPPEALSESPAYSFALDIFSFGVVMLFVLNQQYPQYFENTLTTAGFIRKETQIEKRMKWINKLLQDDPMRIFICKCLKDDPDRRPTTKEVNSILLGFSKSYPKPFDDLIEMQRNNYCY